MANTPKIDLDEIAEAQASKYVTHNTALRKLDCLVQLRVKDKDLSEPPGAPSDGDTYIVGPTSSSSSDWNGYDDYLAYFNSSAWLYIEPQEGLRVWVDDEQEFYVYMSASLGWIKESSLIALTDLSDTPSGLGAEQYKLLRVNAAETALEWTENPYDVYGFVGGKPGAGDIVMRFPVVRPFRVPDDFAGSVANVEIDPADSGGAEFSIQHNGVEFGQFTFAQGETPATWSTDSSIEDFSPGDVLKVIAPNPQDPDLANLGFLIKLFIK